MWITCHDVDDIPSVERLQSLVTNEHHAVLCFPLLPNAQEVTFDKQKLVQRLARHLPDCMAFDSGSKAGEASWITIKVDITDANWRFP